MENILLDPGVPSQHHLYELVEVDGPVGVLVDVPYHVLELVVGGGEPVVPHDAAQLVERDLAVVVRVEQAERLLEAVELAVAQLAANTKETA